MNMPRSPGAGGRPPGNRSGPLAQVRSDVVNLESRLKEVETRLQAMDNALGELQNWMRSTSSPPPRPTVAHTAFAQGTFGDVFLGHVALIYPELREPTQRLLQAQPVDLSDQHYADLLRVLEPFLQPGQSSTAAARWTRTKLSVWIEAARSAGTSRKH
jgi:hypothetical protein